MNAGAADLHPSDPSMEHTVKPAAILIGRNEGARFRACLASLGDQFSHVVYVDSGSTDGSIEAAEAAGLEVVHLDRSQPFTAARARNAGLAQVAALATPPDYVQFMDGDCALQPGWVETARAFLDASPKVAMACGRRRERFPEASVYNRLIDEEWDTPTGRTRASGGDVMGRFAALQAVGGFNPNLIAGEEPELCLRLRNAGWEIWRLDAEMTEHDADLTRFSQWWQRARRAGYTYAEGAAMYGNTPERHKVQALRSTLAWGLALPLTLIALALLVSPWALLGMLIWPLQVLRLRLKGMAWAKALFLTLAKFPETQGVLTYGWRRLTRRRARLIEYK